MNLKFYKNEENRITVELQRTMPGTDAYQSLLRDLNSLTYVATQTIDAAERLAFAEENEASNTPVKLNTLPPVEPEPEPAPTEPAVSLEDVRLAFSAAAGKGVKVGEIIRDFGYTKLSDIPSEKYGDLLAALEAKA